LVITTGARLVALALLGVVSVVGIIRLVFLGRLGFLPRLTALGFAALALLFGFLGAVIRRGGRGCATIGERRALHPRLIEGTVDRIGIVLQSLLDFGVAGCRITGRIVQLEIDLDGGQSRISYNITIFV